MPCATSIHIGVNHPQGYPGTPPLRYSETTAWRMGELARQAGYGSILVLLGGAATRVAVRQAISGVADTLRKGDTLLITFSGHGSFHPDFDSAEDEAWCLYDAELLDDELTNYWRSFAAGVRIVVVMESCYSGGMRRTAGRDEYGLRPAPRRVMRGARRIPRGGAAPDVGTGADFTGTCIGALPQDGGGIGASVLMLTERAPDGLFAHVLLDEWDDGAFRGSYCELYLRVRDRVMGEVPQEPQIMMWGAPDPAFPLAPAFHVVERQTAYRRRGAPAVDDAIRMRTGSPIEHLADSQRMGVRSSLLNRVERWLRGSLDRISDAEVLRALEAQSPAETIAEILVATPETRAASENDWADLLLRGAEAKNQIAEMVGGLLSSSEAAAILGISVPGVKQRMDRRKLLAVPLAGGQWGFPALQFAEGGRVRPGVPDVAKAGAPHDPWTVLSMLVDDVPDGSGILLERLDDPAVLRDVLHRLETYGEHVGA